MLIIRVLVSRATSSVSIQDPDRNIRWSVKLLTETDVQGQLVGENRLDKVRKGGCYGKDRVCVVRRRMETYWKTHTHRHSNAECCQ